MRVVLIVLLVLVLLITAVCLSSIVAEVSYWDAQFEWCVKYFGIRILPRKKSDVQEEAPAEDKPEKPEKPKKKRKAKHDKDEEPNTPDSTDPEEKPKERKILLMDKIWRWMMDMVGKLDLAGSGIAALPGPLQKLFRSITWSDIETDILIGGEDACKTAKLYGTVQALLQTLIGEAAHVIHVKRKSVMIGYDFTEDACRWNARCRIKVNIGTVLAAGIWLAWRFLMDCLKSKKTLVSEKL
ncbi:MAG: hypothetical protein IJ236_04180 [Oscillospiraceae bacterium]|nr:hypothetical protein [Oscillospiraceae bacterium]